MSLFSVSDGPGHFISARMRVKDQLNKLDLRQWGFHGTPLWAGPSILKVLMIDQMEPPSLAKHYEG